MLHSGHQNRISVIGYFIVNIQKLRKKEERKKLSLFIEFPLSRQSLTNNVIRDTRTKILPSDPCRYCFMILFRSR